MSMTDVAGSEYLLGPAAAAVVSEVSSERLLAVRQLQHLR